MALSVVLAAPRGQAGLAANPHLPPRRVGGHPGCGPPDPVRPVGQVGGDLWVDVGVDVGVDRGVDVNVDVHVVEAWLGVPLVRMPGCRAAVLGHHVGDPGGQIGGA
jgi:hypothetical protein